jgi:transposase
VDGTRSGPDRARQHPEHRHQNGRYGMGRRECLQHSYLQTQTENQVILVIDAQSTRSSPQGGPSGFDVGKQIKGRKRSLVVDTLGLVLAVSVVAANVQDRDAASAAVADAAAKYPQISTLFVDSAYAGQFAQATEQTHAMRVEVVRHLANNSVGSWPVEGAPERVVVANADGFVPLPKRWIVERTHAWNERARRLIMHHDRLPKVSETWVWLAEARILLRRLTTKA